MTNPEVVLSVGFGKAGSVLHGPQWLDEGFSIIATDPNPDRLEVGNLNGTMQAAYEAGRLALLPNLEELSVAPSIVDVVTASGNHIEAVSQTLRALSGISVKGSELTWLLEKPVVSSAEEEQELLSLISDGSLDESNVFVNENYNASVGLNFAQGLISQEASLGNPVTNVDVVFYKDRVPDVRKGRYTDPTLGAYGIEVPHQQSVGQTLAGFDIDTPIEIVQNRYHKNMHGVPESEGTYTVVKDTASNTTLRLAQGLGPYKMDGDGNIAKDELIDSQGKPVIIRYATADLSDERQIRIDFDPVPGIDRYHSKVTWEDRRQEPHEKVFADNTLKAVIGSVVRFNQTGELPAFAKGIRVATALQVVRAINSYVLDSGVR